MKSRKLSIMNSDHSETHSLGKVKGTEVMEAFGLSDIYYILSLWRADEVMVDNWSHHPQMHPLGGTSWGIKLEGLLGQWIHMGMSWSPHLNSTVIYGLHNGPSTFLDCLRVCSEVGQFSNPCTCSSE